MPDLVPLRRALLSVSDKTDLVPFARALAARGVELISTGGTARALDEAGLRVTRVEQVTGFPEGLDGRVKTLHPGVHGALLALRDDPEHQAFCKKHGIEPIDLICINLYPFEKTVADPGVSLMDAIENIDVGGPAMIRAAAKNYQWVATVTSPDRYDRVISELDAHDGATTLPLRAELAAAAFGRTSHYDAAIASFLSRRFPQAFPEVLRIGFTKAGNLRYGENPHQEAAIYRDPASTGPSVVNAQQLHGKALSYNNLLDASAALEAVKSLVRSHHDRFGACVVKHNAPCGLCTAETIGDAIDGAISGNAVAAYGGILAVNRDLDLEGAERVAREGHFFEVVVAPAYTDEALTVLRARWANVRLLSTDHRTGSAARKLDMRSIPGGLLVQDRDTRAPDPARWVHNAGPAPDPACIETCALAVVASKHAMSNAIAIAGRDPKTGAVRVLGIGSGQPDRVTSCKLAVAQAGELAKGAVAASDAFFPFPDGPGILADAGITTIVHPGGSKRDSETFELCESRGITCLTTGLRHFRH